MFRILFGLIFLFVAIVNTAPVRAQKATSLYTLKLQLRASSGRSLALTQFRGRPMLVTMIYTRCTTVCPMNVEALRKMVDALPALQRERVGILLVSFDPADTSRSLRQFARDHDASGPPWYLATVSRGKEQNLGALLGVDIRRLPTGDYAHQATIALFDASGELAGLSHSSASNGALLRLLKAIT
jgi:protein SCO1